MKILKTEYKFDILSTIQNFPNTTCLKCLKVENSESLKDNEHLLDFEKSAAATVPRASSCSVSPSSRAASFSSFDLQTSGPSAKSSSWLPASKTTAYPSALENIHE